jgi:hypothetical protein
MNFLDFHNLTKIVIDQLKKHKSSETRIYTYNDKILIGLINLCDMILSVKHDIKESVGKPNSENLVVEVFSKLLFDLLPLD